MKFLESAITGIFLPSVYVFLTLTAPAVSMETLYTNTVKIDPSWTLVAMNQGKSASIPANCPNPTIFWTDDLKGCVVTIINLEHQNGEHTTAMCHYSHEKKSYNEFYLSSFLSSLERENKLSTIKKASCIIIPPGIPGERKITPIIDPEWRRLITETLKAHIPQISFDIQPYLFNVDSSGVKYTVESKKVQGMIVNKSKEADLEYQKLLLMCHNYKEESLCTKLLPLILATSGLIGFFIYNCQ